MPTSPLSQKILIAIIAVLIFGGALFFSQRTPVKQANQTPKVRIAVLTLTSNLPHMIAQEEKLFEKQGLAPEFITFQSSNQAIEAMVRGDVDVSMISLIPFFTIDQKEPEKLKIINTSNVTFEQPFDRIIVKKDSPISDVKQLAGKKVGVFPGTSATNLAKDYLKKQAIDISGMEFIQLPPQNQLTALEAGAIDALYAYEPGLTIGLTQGARAISPSIFASLVNGNPVGVGIITTKLVNEQPETAKKTVAAIDEAIRYQTEQGPKTRAIAKKFFNFDQAVADKFTFTPIFENKNMDKAKVKEFAEKVVSLGELTTAPNTDTIYYQP